MPKHFFSLSQKALLAVSLILLPVIVTFTYGYYKNRNLLKRHVVDDLTVVAEAYEGQVYQFIEMSRRRAEDFSSDGFIIRSLESKDGAGREFSSSLKKHLIDKKLPLDPHIKTISVISPEGAVISSTNSAYAGRDLSKERFFLDGRLKTSATEVMDSTDRAQLVLSTPVSSSGGATVGVLANHILLSELNAVLSGEFNRSLGAISWKKGKRMTMDAYIVNRDGLIIAGANLENGAPPGRNVKTEPVAACVGEKREISGFYANHLGTKVAGASIERSTWLSAAKLITASGQRCRMHWTVDSANAETPRLPVRKFAPSIKTFILLFNTIK